MRSRSATRTAADWRCSKRRLPHAISEILDDIQHLKDRPTRSELKAMRKAHGLTGDTVHPGDRNITEIMDQVAGQHGVEYSTVNAINN